MAPWPGPPEPGSLSPPGGGQQTWRVLGAPFPAQCLRLRGKPAVYPGVLVSLTLYSALAGTSGSTFLSQPQYGQCSSVVGSTAAGASHQVPMPVPPLTTCITLSRPRPLPVPQRPGL